MRYIVYLRFQRIIALMLAAMMIATTVAPALASDDGRAESEPNEERIAEADDNFLKQREQVDDLLNGRGDGMPMQTNKDTIYVSGALFDLLAMYEGDLEENVSLETYLVKAAPDALAEWAVQADRRAKVGLAEYMDANFAGAMGADERGATKDAGKLAVMLATDHADYLYTWQVNNVAPEGQLHNALSRTNGKLYASWEDTQYIPAEEMCLPKYAERVAPAMEKEVNAYLKIRFGKDDCPPSWPPPPPPPTEGCECKHIITFSNDTAGFVSDSDEDDDGDVKHNWWKEEWKAAHYGELYAYIWKEGLTEFDFAALNNENMASIRYKLSCTDRYNRACAQCYARLDQYAHYGSELQVDIDGKGSLFRKKELKAAAGDSAKLITTLGNGQVVGFEKGAALTISSKGGFDGKKVVNILKNVVLIAVEVAKITGDNEGDDNDPDWQKVIKLGAETVGNFFGLVKYEGQEGTKSQSLKATFDSLANATDPTHIIESNVQYTTKLLTAASLEAELKGKWGRTNNSYYGSGFVMAIGVHTIDCVDEVDELPGPAAAWSYANAFRSPYSTTDTFEANAAAFMQQSLSQTSAPNTSSHQGIWTP